MSSCFLMVATFVYDDRQHVNFFHKHLYFCVDRTSSNLAHEFVDEKELLRRTQIEMSDLHFDLDHLSEGGLIGLSVESEPGLSQSYSCDNLSLGTTATSCPVSDETGSGTKRMLSARQLNSWSTVVG